jgi:hypothetical protein
MSLFWQYWGLNSRLQAGALPLEPLHQPFSVLGLMNYLPGLALNHDPPDLCLPSS